MGQQENLSPQFVLDFLKRHRLGVIATASLDAVPEAALINFAVTPGLEIVFETTTATRKFPNLKRNPYADMVIGWEGGQTLQCSGTVDEPEGREGERLRALYLAAFPATASHEHWPGNSYFRLRPHWLRFSDYSSQPRRIAELDLPRQDTFRRGWITGLLQRF